MNDNRSDYDLLVETINKCIKKITIQEIAGQKLVILGSNMTQNLQRMLELCKKHCNDFTYVYVGQKRQIENLDEHLRSRLELVLWNSKYDLTVIDELEEKGLLNSCSGVIFLGTSEQNLRDKNILEIQAMLSKRIGSCCYMYNYNLEEVYEYENIDLYLAGITAYHSMNHFFELLNLSEENL